MRLKEEKTLMIIEAVMLIMVTLSTVFIDWANNQINERMYKIISAQNQANNLIINSLDMKGNYQYYNLLLLLASDKDLEGLTFNSIVYKWVPPTIQQSLTDYHNGKISSKDFVRIYATHTNNLSSTLIEAYNKQKIYLDGLLSNQPSLRFLHYSITWAKISRILNFIRIAFISLAAFLYLLIFKLINDRANKAVRAPGQ